ncbi:MAG: ABC transporter substrate-binding protein [Rhodoferax sp.]|nr:ABC transporter substrate-binding protein [Rhodoferax sp.]
MKRRTILQVAGATTCTALAGSALAQERTKVSYGYSAVSDFATVFVATDEGFFAKRGLDLEPKFIPLNPTIIPGVESGSLQMGGPTSTSYLQAVDGGLDLVVLGGGGVLSKNYTEIALVAKAGSHIRSAKDCVGKKIGVPGLGALLHVTFRQWLKQNGVDPKQVNFIEAPFPQHADLLRSGAVDAVVTGGPFIARILDSGAGYVVSYYLTFLPEGYPTIVHVARRDWARKNLAAVQAFQAGIAEAASFMAQAKNESSVRASLAKYLKLPMPVAARMQISPPGPVVTEKQLKFWADMMRGQGMLKTMPPLNRLLFKA